MVLRISLGITTLPRVCDNWTNTGKPLDQAIFSRLQFLYDRFFEKFQNKEGEMEQKNA